MNKISQNFNYSEFGENLSESDRVKIRWLVFGVLQNVRNYFNRPVRITSYRRDSDNNKKVGGSETSQHLDGEAVDFIVEDTNPRLVYEYITLNLKWPFGQVFYYPGRGHIHIGLPRFDIQPVHGKL